MKYFICVLLFIMISFQLLTSQSHLEVLGNIKSTSLAGNGSRLVQSSSNGTLYNLAPGGSGQVLTSTGNSIFWGSPATGWSLSGNTGTNENSNFIGTRDMRDLNFRTNNIERLTISDAGNIYTSNGGLGNPNIHFQITTEGPHEIGIFNTMKPSSQPFKFALRNFINTDPGETGSVYATHNTLFGQGDQTMTGTYNGVEILGSGTKYAMLNYVLDSPGATYGIRNTIGKKSNAIGIEAGQIVGVDNIISNNNTDAKYGTRNSISESNGRSYGVYNSVTSGTANTNSVYGTYNIVSTAGANTAVAGYFDAGGTNAIAALFLRGNVIMNELGQDYDTRMESDNNENAFLLDAGNDMIRIGSADGATPANGSVINGVTQTYVADFDLGAGINTGTTIGIGSTEYLVDGNFEIFINGGFSPISNVNKDLGFSPMERAWDDVYADDFVNVSDKRAKSNIKNLDYGLAEVLKLRSVTYTLKHDPNQESKVGLIAQEVLSLIPEAVKTHDYKILDENNPVMEKVELKRMGIMYQKLIPVLINATQDQQELIKNQQIQIDQLKKEIEHLKKKI